MTTILIPLIRKRRIVETYQSRANKFMLERNVGVFDAFREMIIQDPLVRDFYSDLLRFDACLEWDSPRKTAIPNSSLSAFLSALDEAPLELLVKTIQKMPDLSGHTKLELIAQLYEDELQT